MLMFTTVVVEKLQNELKDLKLKQTKKDKSDKAGCSSQLVDEDKEEVVVCLGTKRRQSTPSTSTGSESPSLLSTCSTTSSSTTSGVSKPRQTRSQLRSTKLQSRASVSPVGSVSSDGSYRPDKKYEEPIWRKKKKLKSPTKKSATPQPPNGKVKFKPDVGVDCMPDASKIKLPNGLNLNGLIHLNGVKKVVIEPIAGSSRKRRRVSPIKAKPIKYNKVDDRPITPSNEEAEEFATVRSLNCLACFKDPRKEGVEKFSNMSPIVAEELCKAFHFPKIPYMKCFQEAYYCPDCLQKYSGFASQHLEFSRLRDILSDSRQEIFHSLKMNQFLYYPPVDVDTDSKNSFSLFEFVAESVRQLEAAEQLQKDPHDSTSQKKSTAKVPPKGRLQEACLHFLKPEEFPTSTKRPLVISVTDSQIRTEDEHHDLLNEDDHFSTSTVETPSNNHNIPSQSMLNKFKVYRCDRAGCPSMFRYSVLRDSHILGVHEGVKRPYSCKLCSASYVGEGSMRKHFKQKHPDTDLETLLGEDIVPEKDKELTVLISKSKPTYSKKILLVCEECNTEFKDKRGLLAHRRFKHKLYTTPPCLPSVSASVISFDMRKMTRTDGSIVYSDSFFNPYHWKKMYFSSLLNMTDYRLGQMEPLEPLRIFGKYSLDSNEQIDLIDDIADKLFGCQRCDGRFTSDLKLYVHQETYHNLLDNCETRIILRCNRCEQNFDTMSSYGTHNLICSQRRSSVFKECTNDHDYEDKIDLFFTDDEFELRTIDPSCLSTDNEFELKPIDPSCVDTSAQDEQCIEQTVSMFPFQEEYTADNELETVQIFACSLCQTEFDDIKIWQNHVSCSACSVFSESQIRETSIIF